MKEAMRGHITHQHGSSWLMAQPGAQRQTEAEHGSSWDAASWTICLHVTLTVLPSNYFSHISAGIWSDQASNCRNVLFCHFYIKFTHLLYEMIIIIMSVSVSTVADNYLFTQNVFMQHIKVFVENVLPSSVRAFSHSHTHAHTHLTYSCLDGNFHPRRLLLDKSVRAWG